MKQQLFPCSLNWACSTPSRKLVSTLMADCRGIQFLAFSAGFEDLGVDVSVDDLDTLAKRTPVVWLLDGLNEIASPDVRWALADAVSVCSRRWPKARFVLTTTTTALSTHGIPPGFQRVDIDEFRPDDIEAFLDAFCRDFYRDVPEEARREKWEPLAVAIRNSPDLRDMAKSPLRMTAMALAYLQEGRLPDNRADLLRGAVSWLIRKKAPLLRPYVRTGQDLPVIFSELAFQMMAAEDRPLSKVGISWAAERLRPLECFRAEVRDFLDASVSAGGLLVPRGPGDLGMHDAFRDYLAASRIAAKTDDAATGWWNELRLRLDNAEWHSAIALVPASLLLLGGSERVDLFFNRLGAECLAQPAEVRAARIALGGKILRELSLSGYRLGRAPLWAEAVRSARLLFTEPGRMKLDVRVGAAVAYGLMGDDRLVDWEGTWAAIPAGEFWMGGQPKTPSSQNYDRDAAFWEAPVTWAKVDAFEIRKYPITVQDYKLFVDAGGYQADGQRYWTPEAWQWRLSRRIEAPAEWLDQLSLPNTPVTGVSWHESIAYCKWLSETDANGLSYRLPYEREWEYAARRDIRTGQFRWGDRMQTGDLAEANWAGAFLRRKTPVGLFPTSTTADGVTDLFGNVEEWCMDRWTEDDRADSGDAGPVDEQNVAKPETALPGKSSIKRVVRGGSCIRFSRLCRPSYRSRILQDRRYLTVGLRPIRAMGTNNG